MRIQEILDYSTCSGSYEPMGLGAPMESQAILENPKPLVFAWGHTLYLIADALDVELEKVDTVYEKWPTPERIEFPHGVTPTGSSSRAVPTSCRRRPSAERAATRTRAAVSPRACGRSTPSRRSVPRGPDCSRRWTYR